MIGDTIKQLRIDAKMSRRELASKLNLSLSTISMYERNERTPSINKLSEIASIFNTSLESFIGPTTDYSPYSSTNFLNDFDKLDPMQQEVIHKLITMFLSYSTKIEE